MARSVRIQFEPRQQDGRWSIYDRVLGSWPRERPGVGKIRQAMTTEAEAQAEADRLTTYFEGQAT